MTQQQFHAEVTAQHEKREFIERLFNERELDDEYAEFIMQHSAGDRLICNGDMLIAAMEDGYLADKFIDFMEGK